MRDTAERIDSLIEQAVFDEDRSRRNESRAMIRELASAKGIFPASIRPFYEAVGEKGYSGFTVPAINLRGITYDAARAVFRAAIKDKVGLFILEIARSEIGYTDQRPDEYAVSVLAAAVREGFQGPLFLQGDHFQVHAAKYAVDPESELKAIKDLIREAVDAGFLNIDIDASTIVDLDRKTIEEQQRNNSRVTAEMTRFIRGIEPGGITISVGGEIGEVGGRNSTVEDLGAFMSEYADALGPDLAGLSKISIQTGTSHGGVVLPDGSMATVKIDFDVIRDLSKVAREEFGLAGVVQHGASTLPDEAFHKFPEAGTLEIHLATGFQNLIYDSRYFPSELRERIYESILQKYAPEKKPKDTQEQFIYKTRKKAFGDFKRELWDLPEESLKEIRDILEERFSFLFHKLSVANTALDQGSAPRGIPPSWPGEP